MSLDKNGNGNGEKLQSSVQSKRAKRRNSSTLSGVLNSRLRRIKEQNWLTSSSSEPDEEAQESFKSSPSEAKSSTFLGHVNSCEELCIQIKDKSPEGNENHDSESKGSLRPVRDISDESNRPSSLNPSLYDQECSVQPPPRKFVNPSRHVVLTGNFKALPTPHTKHLTDLPKEDVSNESKVKTPSPPSHLATAPDAYFQMPPTLVNSRSKCPTEPRKRSSLQNDGHVAFEIEKMEAIAEKLELERAASRVAESSLKVAENLNRQPFSGPTSTGTTHWETYVPVRIPSLYHVSSAHSSEFNRPSLEPASVPAKGSVFAEPRTPQALGPLRLKSHLSSMPASRNVSGNQWVVGRSLLCWSFRSDAMSAHWSHICMLLLRLAVIRCQFVAHQDAKHIITAKRRMQQNEDSEDERCRTDKDSETDYLCTGQRLRRAMTRWFRRRAASVLMDTCRLAFTDWKLLQQAKSKTHVREFKRVSNRRLRTVVRHAFDCFSDSATRQRTATRSLRRIFLRHSIRLLRDTTALWVAAVLRARSAAFKPSLRLICNMRQFKGSSTALLRDWGLYARSRAARMGRGRRFVLLRISRFAIRVARAWRSAAVRRTTLGTAAWQILARKRHKTLLQAWRHWHSSVVLQRNEAKVSTANNTNLNQIPPLLPKVSADLGFQLAPDAIYSNMWSAFLRTEVHMLGDGEKDSCPDRCQNIFSSSCLIFSSFVAIAKEGLLRQAILIWTAFITRRRRSNVIARWLHNWSSHQSSGPQWILKICIRFWAGVLLHPPAVCVWLLRAAAHRTLRPVLYIWRSVLRGTLLLETLCRQKYRCIVVRRLRKALQALTDNAFRRDKKLAMVQSAERRLDRRRALRVMARWYRAGPTLRALAAAVGIGQATSRWKLDATLLQFRCWASARSPRSLICHQTSLQLPSMIPSSPLPTLPSSFSFQQPIIYEEILL